MLPKGFKILRISQRIIGFFHVIEELVFPPVCAIKHCANRRWKRGSLCLTCLKKLKRQTKLICLECGKADCREGHDTKPPGFEGVFSLFELDSILKEIIHGFKYDYYIRYGRYLAKFIKYRQDLKEQINEVDYLIPVPLHAIRQRERGYNQSTVIADTFSEYLRLPVRTDLLLRRKNTSTQTALSGDQRKRNIKGAFSLGKQARISKGKKVCLVDDVYTTGATTNECIQTLLKAGIRTIGILTLAHSRSEQAKQDFEMEIDLANGVVF